MDRLDSSRQGCESLLHFRFTQFVILILDLFVHSAFCEHTLQRTANIADILTTTLEILQDEVQKLQQGTPRRYCTPFTVRTGEMG